MTVKYVSGYLTAPTMSPSGWMRVKSMLFVRVETDDGFIGWGECYTLAHREQAMLYLLESLGAVLLGHDADDVAGFVSRVQLQIAEQRPGIDLYCVMSGLEMALWDIRGKRMGKPVYELLGGERRSHRLYLNCWSNLPISIDDMLHKIERARERRVDAFKLYPFVFTDDWREAAELLTELRSTVGDEVDIMIDCSRKLDESRSIEFCRAVESARLYWFEEPVSSRDAVSLSNIRRQITTPLVSGESVCGLVEFRTLLHLEAVDIINPDVACCGGIAELTQIAQLASEQAVEVSPHNYNSMLIGLAASVQVANALPGKLILEYFEDHVALGQAFGACDISLDNGSVLSGNTPGLGVHIEEHKLRELASRVIDV